MSDEEGVNGRHALEVLLRRNTLSLRSNPFAPLAPLRCFFAARGEVQPPPSKPASVVVAAGPVFTVSWYVPRAVELMPVTNT